MALDDFFMDLREQNTFGTMRWVADKILLDDHNYPIMFGDDFQYHTFVIKNPKEYEPTGMTFDGKKVYRRIPKTSYNQL